MPHYKFLIIGGGLTADAAVRGIRQTNTSDSIGIICDEAYEPYNRPPLSKALWKGEAFDYVWRKTPLDKVQLHLSRTATEINPKTKTVVDDQGTQYTYDKLLIATGGSVRTLPQKVEGLIYFRTLDDYKHVRTLTEHGKSFVVIGGGFIGSEIAAALAMNAMNVTMIFPEDTIGARVYPTALARFIDEYYATKDVTVLSKDGVATIEKREEQYLVTTTNGKKVVADGVIAGIGITPNVGLAQAAGLKVENGIVVDEFLQTSHPDIFAAGDVANFFNPLLEKRVRLEHEDNAIHMGEVAGTNMAGAHTGYHYLPYFYSDLFELGYEAIGELDVKHETVEDWKTPFREGVVYYLHEGRVRGVLLWNTWGQLEAARSLMAEPGPFTAQNVKGRLPA